MSPVSELRPKSTQPMYKLFALFMFLLIIQMPLCAQAPQSFEGISRLRISVDRYDVRISKSAGNRVTVSNPDKTNSILDIASSDGLVDIHQRQKDAAFLKPSKLEIEVPDGVDIAIQMNSGDLSINHVAGSFQVSSKQGDIHALISLTKASHFESESGTVEVKLESKLQANLHISAGSGRAILDFSKHPISARFTMDSFYPSGTIKAPFEFKEVHITRSYGPDSIVKTTDIGGSQQEVNLRTGGGTLTVIQ